MKFSKIDILPAIVLLTGFSGSILSARSKILIYVNQNRDTINE